MCAVIKRGILGGFKGKIGNIIGSSWKGIATMRAQPLSVANPKSAGQVTQRGKFSFAVSIAQTILTVIIKPLWDRFAVQMSGYNSFIKANVAELVSYAGTDWSAIKFSIGKIGNAGQVSFQLSAATEDLYVEWDSTSGVENKLDSDIPYIVLVNVTGEFIAASVLDATRASSSTTVTIPSDTTVGDLVYGYLMFARSDGSLVSSSEYVVVTVQ
jgi:hypothetical protein